ncbi:hypothetical protein A2774_00450 [Candidatus Roizmanbacteria bacterium RIFCSPHIGHO2_01_FULL_39_12c]|uniref:Transposase IS200-like domain-containing protein n=1 Tax=Candidatus Roizmanbacteria bacterium RIFCSPHIGHO2_01_FULL_39_12c TaxID=1802031 RepID=A0A1F7GEM6_9BACT|nr:MAG: hypothetical protein A2774_00450 [Candidatus Roizmanbacteria bacterium RIFCSPHIGHO2_01_FULL_39_12c]
MKNLRFRNKYRIPSTRLPNWDYSSAGWYYVTICTKRRVCYFGEIINRKKYLSQIGKLVEQEWLKTQVIRSNVKLDEFTIMPNHIHGIIVIKYTVETHNSHASLQKHSHASLQKHSHASLQKHSHASLEFNKFGPQTHNLAAIIRGFKSSTSSQIRRSGLKNFSWQSRFYDHIIRSEQSLFKIREYISNNHLNWDTDEENPKKYQAP